ncbi:uncharacterized protein [Rutidosis leptorrhynchoides]|uniref:uncharacterized protein n=1 Tax=Rutidosis leptorrhynchoides TaxID=125765 RepID=UPI003A9A42CA
MIIWDTSRLVVNEAVERRHLLAIKGKWRCKENETVIVNVYGPHKDPYKKSFWESLDGFMNLSGVDWVICGDFNEVRNYSECQNSVFVESRAKLFNSFIENNHLIEVPLLGKRFTRISDDGKKFSKLDRFLVTESFLHSWGDISAIALDRRTSDHCPIILRDKDVDFGPKPFKFFDEWLECKEIEKIRIDAWNILIWSKTRYGLIDVEIESWKHKALEFESKADQGMLTDDDRDTWIEARAKWLRKENEKAGMLKQKSRLKWVEEGDDNTAFFHATIRRRNNVSSIRGLHISGVWEESPDAIKRKYLPF